MRYHHSFYDTVCHDKLISAQPVNKFHIFNGTQRFIILFARTHKQTQSCCSYIHTHSFNMPFNIVLPSIIRSPKWSLLFWLYGYVW